MRIRRRIKIKALEAGSKRHSRIKTTRRDGLFKNTKKFCKMAGAKAGVVVISKEGNAFGFAHPAVQECIDRHQLQSTSDEIEADSGAAGGGAVELEKAANLPSTKVKRRLVEAVESDEPAWDVAVEDLGTSELDELEEKIKRIQRLAAERVKKLKAAGGR